MAMTTSSVLSCRSTVTTPGAGGFDASYGGTDYSIQDSPQAAGTATSVGATLTATTAIFTSAMVGNGVTDGTSFYTIAGFTSSTIVTLNGGPSWTGASIKVGGAVATLAALEAIMQTTTPNAWIAGTFTLTSAVTLSISGANQAAIAWTGYATTPGDGGSATITSSTSGTDLIDVNGAKYRRFENFIMNHTASGTRGIAFTMHNGGSVHGMVFKNIISSGCLRFIWGDNGSPWGVYNDSIVEDCDIKNCTDVGIICVSIMLKNSKIHGCSSHGLQTGNGSDNITFVDDIAVYGNGGDGLHAAGSATSFVVRNSTVRNNTGDNINTTAVSGGGLTLENSLIMKAGGKGVNLNSLATTLVSRNNAYWSNSGGDRANFAAGTGDVALTAEPHSNYASDDFSLNATSGAGASCRAAGFPGAGQLGNGYGDIGPLQHQDAGGGSGGIIRRGFSGGFEG